jgi:hypothetical protein
VPMLRHAVGADAFIALREEVIDFRRPSRHR